jgi:hypothetical protein
MLWKKAIPIQQRIREIKEGLTREYVETIQGFEETLSLVSKVMSYKGNTDNIFSHRHDQTIRATKNIKYSKKKDR